MMTGAGIGILNPIVYGIRAAAGFFASGINHFFSQASFDSYTAGVKTLVTSANFASLGYTASGGTNGTVVNAAGNFVTQAAPRFMFSGGVQTGLLVEESRTNGVTNNSMQGAVGGSPGTLPTRWTQGGGAGLTRTIALGTELGQPYIDIRWTGTTSDTQIALYTEDNMTIAAGTNQARCHSAYVRMTAGSLTNISSTEIGILEQNSGGGFVAASATPFTLTGSWQRAVRLHTTNATGTAYSKPYITLFYASGVAIDIAIRILLPVEEQGSFPTSPIVTSGAAVTRSADDIDAGSLLSNTGTAVVSATLTKASVGVSQALLGRPTDAIPLFVNQIGIFQMHDGVNYQGPSVYAADGTQFTAAAYWSGAVMKLSVNGGAAAGGAFDGTMGSGVTQLGRIGTALRMNGLFQRLGWATAVATDAQLAQLSAATL